MKEWAKLRLRPKVMTVGTTVAGLLPIMWSTSTGSEVMRPLAAPVLGGMISSFLHIMVITPVLFAWLHGREMKLLPSPAPPFASSRDPIALTLPRAEGNGELLAGRCS